MAATNDAPPITIERASDSQPTPPKHDSSKLSPPELEPSVVKTSPNKSDPSKCSPPKVDGSKPSPNKPDKAMSPKDVTKTSPKDVVKGPPTKTESAKPTPTRLDATGSKPTPPKSETAKPTPPKSVKGPIVVCIACNLTISQKSIKTHFLNKHPERDYEDQKEANSTMLRTKRPSLTPVNKTSPTKTVPKPLSKPSPKSSTRTTVVPRRLSDNSSEGLLVQDRPEVIVACVICYEMMSTKTIKGHFARHHPEQNYEALKQSMSSASPMKGNAELVNCAACKKIVSSRTLKVHILKNHPNLDYKTTLKASREGVVKNASPGTIIMKSPHKPAPRSVQLMRSGVVPPSFSGYHSEPRTFSKNETYPCTICQKEVLFQNMKKHFKRMHPTEIAKYESLKRQRTAERNVSVRSLSSLDGGEDHLMEVNNNAEDEYSPSALLKEIEQEMTKECGTDPYSHLMSRNPALHVQVTEQVIRFDADDEIDKYTEINPPSSKVVPAAEVSNLVLGESSSENGKKRKISELDYDSNGEDNELYKRLATENYMLERQILYLQEQEQFLEQKMVAYQRIMERKMREFEQKLRTEFEGKSRKLQEDLDLREEKMREKMAEQERWLTKRLDAQRRVVEAVPLSVPTPPASDNKSDSSKSSGDDHAERTSLRRKGGRIIPETSSVETLSGLKGKTKPVPAPAPKPGVRKLITRQKSNTVEADPEDTFIPEENEDFNLSYETENETEPSPPKPKPATIAKNVVKKAKVVAPASKLKKLGKLRKLVGKASIPVVPRFNCTYCSRGFKKKWDFQKHCQSKTHLAVVKAKSQSEQRETHAKCADYGCLICGLNFDNGDAVKSHMEGGCSKERHETKS